MRGSIDPCMIHRPKGGAKGGNTMRLIDADTLKEYVLDRRYVIYPLQHGRWKRTDAYPHRIYCSVCYSTYAQEQWRVWVDGSLPRLFCPNCGAKMDGDEE